MRMETKKSKTKYTRFEFLYIVMAIVITIILGKLLYLQIYKYSEYKEKADVSSLRFIADETPRGEIYDSDGEVLATNKQTYAITYMKTDEATSNFYFTMNNIFKILDENNEIFQDNLLLKISEENNFYFDFNTEDLDTRRDMELAFKRDRGLNEIVKGIIYKNKKGDFSDAELLKLEEAVLKVPTEDTFYYLVSQYNLYELLLEEWCKYEDKKKLKEKYELIKSEDKNLLKTYILRGKAIINDLMDKYTLSEIRNYLSIQDAIKMESFKGYKSVTIAENIKKETAFIIYQYLSGLPGIDIKLKPIRCYPNGTLASSVLGYVSPINGSQKEVYELKGYDVSSDLIGVSGIESSFESYLKANKGGTTIKTNSSGREVSKLFKLESFPGNNVHLTIDKDIQYAAQESLKDIINSLNGTSDVIKGVGLTSATRGAAVAIEVNTGRLLAVASYPDYDPNIFAIPGSLSSEESKKYFSPDYEGFYNDYKAKTNAVASLEELFPLDNTGNRRDEYDVYPRPFFNYATQGPIPPGSSFKPLTALLGLEEGVITADEIINDTGVWNIHSDVLQNYAPTNFMKIGNGKINVEKALEVSSNFFFYETAFRLYEKYGFSVEGLNSIARYAYKFGLGADMENDPVLETGIEIYEDFGQVYNFNSFKNQVIKSSMFSLVEFLNIGKYGGYSFVPLDAGINEIDETELSNAKSELKDKVKDRLKLVGTNEEANGVDEFAEELKPYIKRIVDLSESYSNTVQYIESIGGNKIDINSEVISIANAIAHFTIFDQANAITSPAEVINAGIGQGMSRFTPIQLVNYIATLANGGTRYNVRLVDKITSYSGEVIEEYSSEVVEKIDIDPANLQTVKNGMYAVNHNDSSSFAVQQFKNFPIPTAGKTGTADLVNNQEDYDFIGRYPFATYGSFAPVDTPQIATFTVIYDGGRGSYASFPSKAIYEAYFKNQLLEMDPNYADKSETFRKYVLRLTE